MKTPRNRFEGDFSPSRIPTTDWRFRFDQPPTPADLIDSFDGDLFRLLHLQDAAGKFEALHQSNIEADAQEREDEGFDDRRESERHRPATSSAMIGWWRGAEFVVFNVVILNLGPGGMMIRLDEHPTRAQPVWLCLGEPKLETLAQARVLDTLKTPKETYQVRLVFHSPCPLEFLEAAGKRSEA